MPETNAGNAATKEKIIKLRTELYALVEEFGLEDGRVLEFSRKLDLLILELAQAAE